MYIHIYIHIHTEYIFGGFPFPHVPIVQGWKSKLGKKNKNRGNIRKVTMLLVSVFGNSCYY